MTALDFCPSHWQGPAYHVIDCVNREGHHGHHVGYDGNNDRYVFWTADDGDLEAVTGEVVEQQESDGLDGA